MVCIMDFIVSLYHGMQYRVWQALLAKHQVPICNLAHLFIDFLGIIGDRNKAFSIGVFFKGMLGYKGLVHWSLGLFEVFLGKGTSFCW